MLTNRENFIRNVRFEKPEWIPANVAINDASWDLWRDDLASVCMRFPQFFGTDIKPGWRDYDPYEFAPGYRKGEPFTDAWGCVWQTACNGIEGVVTHGPLADWDLLPGFQSPDPETTGDRGPLDWPGFAQYGRLVKQGGDPFIGYLPHGFLFMRITYLRGFENAMVDFAMEAPELDQLIEKLVAHNLALIHHFIAAGVDMVEFAEDLGSQESTILSPDLFRRYLKPAYHRLMEPCRQAGILVGFHSDGKTLDILEDQIEAGVQRVNPQDLCNGIDNLARRIKGKACIQLDIDRQTIIPFGTAHDIDDLIREEVMKLGSPNGGLEFIAGIYPPTPPQNVEALCKALLKYQRYWWQ